MTDSISGTIPYPNVLTYLQTREIGYRPRQYPTYTLTEEDVNSDISEDISEDVSDDVSDGMNHTRTLDTAISNQAPSGIRYLRDRETAMKRKRYPFYEIKHSNEVGVDSYIDDDDLKEEAYDIWLNTHVTFQQCTDFMDKHWLRFSLTLGNSILAEILHWMHKPKNVRYPNNPKMLNMVNKIPHLIKYTNHNSWIDPFTSGKYSECTLMSMIGLHAASIFSKIRDILLSFNPTLLPACDDNAPIFDREDKKRSLRKLLKYLRKVIRNPSSIPEQKRWAQNLLSKYEDH